MRSVGICRWNVSGGNGERYGTVAVSYTHLDVYKRQAVYLFHLLAEVLQVIAQLAEQIAQVFGIQPGKVFGFALEDTVGEILELDVYKRQPLHQRQRADR